MLKTTKLFYVTNMARITGTAEEPTWVPLATDTCMMKQLKRVAMSQQTTYNPRSCTRPLTLHMPKTKLPKPVTHKYSIRSTGINEMNDGA